MDVVLCRLNHIATDGAGLRCGFRSFRAGSVILGIAVGAAGLAKMGVVQIAAGGPLGGIGGMVFRNLQVSIAANRASAFFLAGGNAARMVF